MDFYNKRILFFVFNIFKLKKLIKFDNFFNLTFFLINYYYILLRFYVDTRVLYKYKWFKIYKNKISILSIILSIATKIIFRIESFKKKKKNFQKIKKRGNFFFFFNFKIWMGVIFSIFSQLWDNYFSLF
jgi:hypothetical protein